MRIGTTELLIILLVVLIIFGPTQIPKLTKMFGKSVKSFKDGMDEGEKKPEVTEAQAQTQDAAAATTTAAESGK